MNAASAQLSRFPENNFAQQLLLHSLHSCTAPVDGNLKQKIASAIGVNLSQATNNERCIDKGCAAEHYQFW